MVRFVSFLCVLVGMKLLHGLYEVIAWLTWSYCMVYMKLLHGLY